MFNRIVSRIIHKLKQIQTNLAMSELTQQVAVKRPVDTDIPSEVTAKKLKQDNQSPVNIKVKRKKVALLTVYSGKGYHGVQIQTKQGYKTVESELVKAMLGSELITQEHVDDMSKMWFQRASRTDKGVSAAGQVFSLLMRTDIEDCVERINSRLPDNIRTLAVKKTTKGFDAKNSCSHRSYEYLTPTFAFAPLDQLTTEEFRITDELIVKINEVMQHFKGTHNFHNFTSRRKFHDRSSNRYMMLFETGKPFVLDGIEFLVITVRGQSFMLHQIRKMIGLTMAIVKGYASLDTIELCWGPSKVDIPKAPGLGLLLDKLHYDAYNKRFGSDGVHEPIDWSEYQDKIEKFKMEHIYADIMKTEKEERGMFEWLQTLHLHSYQTYEEGSKANTIDQSGDEEEIGDQQSKDLKPTAALGSNSTQHSSLESDSNKGSDTKSESADTKSESADTKPLSGNSELKGTSGHKCEDTTGNKTAEDDLAASESVTVANESVTVASQG